jgi:hypothetical protein
VLASPSSEAPLLGRLQVARPWYLEEESPCEWIEVAVVEAASGNAVPVPFMEFSYEQPGLVVLERNQDWFRISMGERSGWIRYPTVERYLPYQQLVQQSLAYLPPGWSGELWESPEAGASFVPMAWAPFLASDLTVEVLEYRLIQGEPWLKLSLDPEYGCGTLPGSPPAVEGWIPAYRASGENAVWFHSRGC